MAEFSTTYKENPMYDSKLYNAYRKNTPEEIVSKIVFHLKQKFVGTLDIAVDVGCGSGQGTAAFAPYFRNVYGIDRLETQIEEAESCKTSENVIFQVGSSDILPFDDGSVQLITAATSLHWFDLDAFFPESRRVLCNNGILAVYGYSSMKPLVQYPSSFEKLDKLYDKFQGALGAHITPKMQILYQKYQNIDFPFEEVIREPDVRYLFKGKLSDIVGYIRTFSCYKSFLEENPEKGEELVKDFEKGLYEITASENLSDDNVITLFVDYILIICRKTV